MAYKQPSSGPFKMMGSSPVKHKSNHLHDHPHEKTIQKTQTVSDMASLEAAKKEARAQKKKKKEKSKNTKEEKRVRLRTTRDDRNPIPPEASSVDDADVSTVGPVTTKKKPEISKSQWWNSETQKWE